MLLYFKFLQSYYKYVNYLKNSQQKKKSLKIISQETTVTNSRKYLMNWPTLFSQHQIR